MTRDDIIRAGQKVGLLARTESLLARETLLLEMLERFAALVAAHERAACAAICDEEARGINPKYGKIMALMIGERIRVRGTQ